MLHLTGLCTCLHDPGWLQRVLTCSDCDFVLLAVSCYEPNSLLCCPRSYQKIPLFSTDQGLPLGSTCNYFEFS